MRFPDVRTVDGRHLDWHFCDCHYCSSAAMHIPSNTGTDCHMPGCADTSICPKKSLKPAQLVNSAILPSIAFQNNSIYRGVTVKGGARPPDFVYRSTVRAFLRPEFQQVICNRTVMVPPFNMSGTMLPVLQKGVK